MVGVGVGHFNQVNDWSTATSGSALCGLFCAGFILALGACSATKETSEISGAGASALGAGANSNVLNGGGSSGFVLQNVGGTMASADVGGSGGKDPGHQAITTLPPGFHQTDIGGYQLGSKIDENAPGGGSNAGGASAGGGSSAGGFSGSGGVSAGGGISAGGASGSGGAPGGDCGNILLGVVRDFKGSNEAGGHADFEAKIEGGNVTPGLVSSTLGTDRKPVYASQCEIGNPGAKDVCPYGAQTSSRANFDQWYRDTPGVNEAYTVSLFLAPRAGGLFTFQSLAYFPIDGVGFMGSAKADDGMLHNFGFTTELHTQFLYTGGETFNFQGDDDVWVYINNKLAVDLGGLHPMQMRSVSLDDSSAALGIVKGTIYPLDLFHAERHTTASTFRIDTNLSFTDCGTVIPGKVK